MFAAAGPSCLIEYAFTTCSGSWNTRWTWCKDLLIIRRITYNANILVSCSNRTPWYSNLSYLHNTTNAMTSPTPNRIKKRDTSKQSQVRPSSPAPSYLGNSNRALSNRDPSSSHTPSDPLLNRPTVQAIRPKPYRRLHKSKRSFVCRAFFRMLRCTCPEYPTKTNIFYP